VEFLPERIHALTFAAGTDGYLRTAKRLVSECENSGYFESVVSHSDSSIEVHFPTFYHDLMSFVERYPRGFGLWVWKPFLILKTLESLPNDKLLLYLDAGCSINANSRSERRWIEYLELARKNGVLAFRLNGDGFTEREWNRRDLIEIIGIKSEDLFSNQIEPGVAFFNNTTETRDFVREWLSWCTRDDYKFLRDPELSEQYPEHKEYRWDQSIFSLLYKKKGFPIVDCETFFAPDWIKAGADFPVWATRNRLPDPERFKVRCINALFRYQRVTRDLLFKR
jgi:hypothetical protein